MPPVGFELAISAGMGPQTYALDRAATGTDFILLVQDAIRNRDKLPFQYFTSEYVSTFDRPVTSCDMCLSNDLHDKYLSEYILHERQNFNTPY